MCRWEIHFTKVITNKKSGWQHPNCSGQRKWSIKPSLAEKMVDILQFMADKDEITTKNIVTHFGFTATTGSIRRLNCGKKRMSWLVLLPN